MKKWVAVVMLAGCMSPVMHFGAGKSAKQAQHDVLVREFWPAPLATEGTYAGPVKTVTVRVYADDAYRAQNLEWRQAFDEGLEYANAVLGSNFGVRLVADYREWQHHAPGYSLDEHLTELRALDTGEHVLTVIGLTSSLSLVSATFDQLGYASVPGKHMMLRGYADLEERKAFTRAFPDLPAEERANALVARRHHKLAALLLHELAHNLGVDHEVAEDTLMNARYSEHAADFSADARATIQRALDQRLGRVSADRAVQTPSTTAPQAMQAAATATPAAATTKVHRKLYIHIMPETVLVEGRSLDLTELSTVFSMQAAMDGDSEVVISKERDVPRSRVVDVMDRAKAQGIKKFSMQ